MALPPELRSASEGATRWDWWPLARLLIVIITFGTLAHYRFGWEPDIASLATLPRRVFEVLSLFTVLSFALAHLYLMLLAFPIYAVVTLNDSLYAASRWAFGTLFRSWSERLLDLAGLAGEIGLFGASAYGLLRVFGTP